MLQKDYFLRLVEEFAQALIWLQNKKDREKKLEELRLMYQRYLGGPYEFYHTATLEDAVDAISQYPENERFQRLEMLAELYYAESPLHSLPIRQQLLEKAYAIFYYCDQHSGSSFFKQSLHIHSPNPGVVRLFDPSVLSVQTPVCLSVTL